MLAITSLFLGAHWLSSRAFVGLLGARGAVIQGLHESCSMTRGRINSRSTAKRQYETCDGFGVNGCVPRARRVALKLATNQAWLPSPTVRAANI